MSILGYSSSYFLPEYWAGTPLYGEKILPLIDYLLSNEYEESDKLAQAYYNIVNKYKNPADLPINVVEEIIDESGYSYVKDLLGGNEESLRLLLSLMVLIHELKGTKLGIQVVLNLLRKDNSITVMQTVGSPRIDANKNAYDFSLNNYIVFQAFTLEGNDVELKMRVGGFKLEEQCIASIPNHNLYIGIDKYGHLILSVGSGNGTWDILDNARSTRTLTAGSEYYIKLLYDGYEYSLQVSSDGKLYDTWITASSREPLRVNGGTLYLGIDFSTENLQLPFTGYINFSDFALTAENIEITQWFEQTPVDAENTFIIKTDLDVTLVTTEFFENFSNFIRHYVYPTLKKFIASLTFTSHITFLPYVRTKIRYVAYGDVSYTTPFLVKTYTYSEEATDAFQVLSEEGEDYLNFEVQDTVVLREPYLIKERPESEEATDPLLVVGVVLDMENFNVIQRIE